MRRNKKLWICIFAIVLLSTAGLLAGNLIAAHSFRKITEEYNIALASLLGIVKEKYPDVAEEEWIGILNHNEKYEEGRLLLKQYGIFRDQTAMLEQKKQQEIMIFGMDLIIVIMGAGSISALLLYYRNRARNLDRLAAYIRKVEQGEYLLPVMENTEDELSSLKNELYKVTVMLKEAANLSRDQKKALADSVSDISHQIKTPLTSAMILLDNLSESEKMEEATRKDFLVEITRQLSHINWLTATMLKISRLDAGVVEFNMHPFNMSRLLDEASSELEMLAEWKQIKIVNEGDRDITITGDFQWIREAVANLVKNAIEHSQEGGKIILRVQDNAVYSSIVIKDFGEGMDQEEQKHIFERFYRSGNAAKDSVGIGLSLAKEIIEHQNGYLTVSSQKGKGTEFLIKFIKT